MREKPPGRDGPTLGQVQSGVPLDCIRTGTADVDGLLGADGT